jgi:urease accessory protein
VRRFAVAFLVLHSATPALAHSPIPGVTGFSGGVLHPLLVPAHLMTLAAFGLLLGQQAPRQRYPLLAIFAASLLSGIGAVAAALAAENPDAVVLVAAAILGLLVAVARPLPLIGVGPIVFALGVALELDSVPQETSMRATLVTLGGTALAAFAIPALLAILTTYLQRDWQRIGARVFGSWVAAGAILVLALRLAR